MNKEQKPSSKRFAAGESVGVLGGGQLARMLLEPAFRLGLRPMVLCESAEMPAARATSRHVEGNETRKEAIDSLLSQVSLVVFENEFIDVEALKAASARAPNPVRFCPDLEVIETLRDKARQKTILKSMGIPTAPFSVYSDSEPLSQWVETQRAEFGGTCVFKWGRFGYDGHGVFVANSDDTALARAIEFCEKAIQKGVSLYAEEKISFRRELAIVGVHSVTGEFASYPLVISVQKESICHEVFGPATSLGVDSELEWEAMSHAERLAKSLKLHGCFAIEFFETESGALLVNEIAPRVHNSGHYTQDAASTSQFENHWRAVLGLPLGSTRTVAGFVMLNLLGPASLSCDSAGIPLPNPEPAAHLHWYDKNEIRPGRKLGHLNGVARKAARLEELVEWLRHCRDTWEIEVRQTRK